MTDPTAPSPAPPPHHLGETVVHARGIEKYFGRLPKAPAPEPLRTVEPPQKAGMRQHQLRRLARSSRADLLTVIVSSLSTD